MSALFVVIFLLFIVGLGVLMHQGQQENFAVPDICKGLGRPNSDNSLRIYSQDECNQLNGSFSGNGECGKPGDASYSWQCRELNSMPAPAPASANGVPEFCKGLGRPSSDSSLRIYNGDECNQLSGNFHGNGECYKQGGGSYSYDCRALNSMPPAQKCAAPMGNPAPEVAGWKYKGCFKDCAAGRGLPNRLDNVTSIEQCIAQAKAKGYNTAGNQYFGECWAGNNTDWDRMGDAGCCEPLGGNCTQQIYSSGQAPAQPAEPPCVCGDPNYECHKNQDHGGDDIQCLSGTETPESCAAKCNGDPKCLAFNVWTPLNRKGCCLKTAGNITGANNTADFCVAKSKAPKQVDTIARGLDEQKKGWQTMGKDKYARCYRIQHDLPKTLDECKDLCVNGDKTNPGNNECNTINFQRKTDKSESLCSTHKCRDVNKPNMHKKPGTDVYSWFG